MKKEILISEDHKKFLIENYKKLGKRGCSEVLGFSMDKTHYHANKLNLIKKNKQWGDEEIENFQKFYEENGTRETMAWFKMSKARVEGIVRKFKMSVDKVKLSSRKSKALSEKPFQDYKINPTVFLTPTSVEIAYILGLLYADGHIRQKSNYVCVSGIEYDLETLEWIFRKTGQWNKSVYADKRSGSRQMILSVTNKYIKNFLVSNGFLTKSGGSADLILSIIPKENHYLFFRGFLDGDGHIGKNAIIFCGPEHQDWSFVEENFKELNIKYSITRRSKTENNKGGSSSISIFKIQDRIKYCNYIYKNYNICPMGLRRKYEKFQNLLERASS